MTSRYRIYDASNQELAPENVRINVVRVSGLANDSRIEDIWVGGRQDETVEDVRRYVRVATIAADNRLLSPATPLRDVRDKPLIGYEIAPNPPKRIRNIESFTQFIIPTIKESGEHSNRPFNYLFTILGEQHLYSSQWPRYYRQDGQNVIDFIREETQKTSKTIYLMTETNPLNINQSIDTGHLAEILPQLPTINVIPIPIDIRNYDNVLWVYAKNKLLTKPLFEISTFDINTVFNQYNRHRINNINEYVLFLNQLTADVVDDGTIHYVYSNQQYANYLRTSLIPSITTDADRIHQAFARCRHILHPHPYRDLTFGQLYEESRHNGDIIINEIIKPLQMFFIKIVDIYILTQLFRREYVMDHVILLIGDSHARHLSDTLDSFIRRASYYTHPIGLDSRHPKPPLEIPLSFF
jgi:hypothetical protein